jgi:hypothetical protein
MYVHIHMMGDRTQRVVSKRNVLLSYDTMRGGLCVPQQSIPDSDVESGGVIIDDHVLALRPAWLHYSPLATRHSPLATRHSP